MIPQTMLRLLAKQEQRAALLSVQKGDTQVSHIAKELPQLPGTTLKTSYIKKREDSWKLHLQHISPFLTEGEGVWWEGTSTGFHFLDGDADSASQGDEFVLLHYHHHSIVDIHLDMPLAMAENYLAENSTEGGSSTEDPTSENLTGPENTIEGESGSMAENCTGEFEVDHTGDSTSQSLQSSIGGSSGDSSTVPDNSTVPDKSTELPSSSIQLTLPKDDNESLKTSVATYIKKLLNDVDGLTEFDKL